MEDFAGIEGASTTTRGLTKAEAVAVLPIISINSTTCLCRNLMGYKEA